jgi:hypothetical protein
VSAESEDRQGAKDLDLKADEADRVKGGRLDPGGGGGGSSNIGSRRKHKKRSKSSNIGPYKGKH